MEAAAEAADQNVEKGQRSALHQQLVERAGSGGGGIRIEVGPIAVGTPPVPEEDVGQEHEELKGDITVEAPTEADKNREESPSPPAEESYSQIASMVPDLALRDKAAWVESTAKNLAKYLWLWQNKGGGGTQEGCEQCCEHGIPMVLHSENNQALQAALGRIEELEDELAMSIALKEKAEAEAGYAEAQMDRMKVEKNRISKTLDELVEERKTTSQKMTLAYNKLAESLGDLDAQRAKTNILEEDLHRMTKQKELLEAEKYSWQVTEGGANEEVKRACAESAKAQQELVDAQRYLTKERQRVQQLEEQLSTLQEEMEKQNEVFDEPHLNKQMVEAARGEAEDMRSAVGELEAEVSKLKAEKNVMMTEIQNLKNRSKEALLAAQVESAEARMVQRSLETKLGKLKAEKKVLISEVKAARKALSQKNAGEGLHKKFSFASTTSLASERDSDCAEPVNDTKQKISSTDHGSVITQDDCVEGGTKADHEDPDDTNAQTEVGKQQFSPLESSDRSSFTAIQPAKPAKEEDERRSKSTSPVFVKGTEVSEDFDSEKLGELCVADPTFCNVHRQLLECRERKHTLSNLLEEEPDNADLQKLLSDVTSAVKSLEVRMQVLIKTKQESV